MEYVKKLEIVEAVKYEVGAEDGFMDMAGESVPYINTTHGFQNIVEDGDYIVTHTDGHRQCVPDEVFESMYVEYREPAECYVIESFGIDEVLCDSSEELPELDGHSSISFAYVVWTILLLTASVWASSVVITIWIMTPI